MKKFKPHLSACILGRAMKLLIQILQRHISLPKNLNLLNHAIRRSIHSIARFKGQSSEQN